MDIIDSNIIINDNNERIGDVFFCQTTRKYKFTSWDNAPPYDEYELSYILNVLKTKNKTHKYCFIYSLEDTENSIKAYTDICDSGSAFAAQYCTLFKPMRYFFICETDIFDKVKFIPSSHISGRLTLDGINLVDFYESSESLFETSLSYDDARKYLLKQGLVERSL